MSSKREPVKFERTSAGLRDALFAELEDLHNGVSTPHEATAFAKLAGNILGSVELDLKNELLKESRLRREEMIAQRIEREKQLAITDQSTSGYDEDLERLGPPVRREVWNPRY